MGDINTTWIFDTIGNAGGGITGATFNPNTGVLSLFPTSGNTITTSIDGRYSLTGHTHDISEITGFTDNSINWDTAYSKNITGATVTGIINKTLKLYQRDGTILSADFIDYGSIDNGGSGDVVTGMTFNTTDGVLTLSTLSGSTVTEDLDGRYLLSADYNPSDDYLNDVTFTNEVIEFTRLSGATFSVDLSGTYALTGHTHTFQDIWDASGTGARQIITDNVGLRLQTDVLANNPQNIYISPATSSILLEQSLTGATKAEIASNFFYLQNSGGRSTILASNITGNNFLELPDKGGTFALTDDLANDYVTGATFNILTGDLFSTRLSGGTYLVNLDGRYALTAHTHDISEITGFTDNSGNWNTAYSKNITGATVTGIIDKTLSLYQRDGSILTAEFVDYGSAGGGSGDVVTGMTFNTSDGVLTLSTLSGSTVTEDLDGRYLLSSDYTPGDSNTDDYVTGATFTNQIIEFTRLSGTTFTVDLSNTYALTGHTHTASDITDFPTNVSYFNNDAGYLTEDADDFITGSTFNTSTGLLTSTRLSGGTFSVNLDGRYALTGHTHDISEITGFTDNSTNWDTAYSDSITGVTVTGIENKTINLYQRDGSILTADFVDYGGDGGGSGDVVTGMTFNTADGILSLSTLSGSTVTEDLDGRYLLSGDYNPSDDYVIGATFSNEIIEFTRLSGATFTVDLSNTYALTGHTHNVSDVTGLQTELDEIITGVTVTGTQDKTISLFKRNGNILTADFVDYGGSGGGSGDVVTGMTFNTADGVLTLSTLSGSTVTEDLDGRYFVEGPEIFEIETSGSTSYVGYGQLNACKIRKITTISGGTYQAFWSEGEETLDKEWSLRTTYSYF